jgi:hypothetical protein
VQLFNWQTTDSHYRSPSSTVSMLSCISLSLSPLPSLSLCSSLHFPSPCSLSPLSPILSPLSYLRYTFFHLSSPLPPLSLLS